MTIGEIVDAVQGEVMCGEDRMFEVVECAVKTVCLRLLNTHSRQTL